MHFHQAKVTDSVAGAACPGRETHETSLGVSVRFHVSHREFQRFRPGRFVTSKWFPAARRPNSSVRATRVFRRFRVIGNIEGNPGSAYHRGLGCDGEQREAGNPDVK